MARKFHFISGLPRSGSTLLSAILRQNPKMHAAMSSPVNGLFSRLISSVSAGSEMAPMVSDQQRRDLSEAIFDAYYKSLDPAREVVFDTSRGWTAGISAVASLYPGAKMLCCVRDMAWIMDSFERKYRENPFENSRMFGNSAQRSTVFARCDAMADRNGVVGYAWSALREALYGEHAANILVIDYDLLVSRPADVMAAVYNFLGEPAFAHDFDNVEYDAPQFDEQLGMKGLHKVHKKVAPRPRQTILPPELFQKYQQQNFWTGLHGTKASIIVSSKQPPKQLQTSGTLTPR